MLQIIFFFINNGFREPEIRLDGGVRIQNLFTQTSVKLS